MKRTLVFGLVLLLVSTAIFAEDAKVMPARVGRFYLAPTFGFANGGFDSDGKYESFDSGEGSMKMFNLGFALEYGIINWITGAIQWAPGINIWSDVDTSLGTDSTVNANGLADLFVGAKMQILGNQGPVENETIRFAIAPGVKIPLPGPDFEEQFDNRAKNEPVTAANIDKHSLGLGVRAYFDYLINDKFFINLYGEFVGYPVKQDIRKSGIESYMAELIAKGGLAAAAPPLAGDIMNSTIIKDGEVNYGYDLTFEMEPVFSTSIGQGTVLTAGLPLNFKLSPAKKYDLTITDEFATLANGIMPGMADTVKDNILNGLNGDGSPNYIFSLKPGVSVFFMGWTLPMEFKVQYSAPIFGQNIGNALHTITFQARLYFKF